MLARVPGGMDMRRFLKTIVSTVSAVAMLLTYKIMVRPPTAEEAALLGPAPARMEVAHLRLARLILDLDEVRGSQALASITGADPELIRVNLRRKAGRDAPLSDYAVPGYAPPRAVEDTAGPAGREMPGGARFIKVN